eukprot:COSAG05_NODE_461_length_9571_cov_14.935283_3_plen_147_part_00
MAPPVAALQPPPLYDMRMTAQVLAACFFTATQGSYAAIDPTPDNVQSASSAQKVGVLALLFLYLECRCVTAVTARARPQHECYCGVTRYEIWEWLVKHVTGPGMCPAHTGEDWAFLAMALWLVCVASLRLRLQLRLRLRLHVLSAV